MAFIYVGIFVCCVVGEVVLILHGKVFVALAQRSNVETLTIAFFLLFFLYLLAVSASGVAGAMRLFYFKLVALRHGKQEAERRKTKSLRGLESADPPGVALNLCVEREAAPREPLRIPIKDDICDMGTLVFDGARLTHEEARTDRSSNLFAFVVEHIRRSIRKRGVRVPFDIVYFKKLNDESAEQFLATVKFSTNLASALNVNELWPTLRLTARECEALEASLRELCPVLRSEGLFPDWEYSGEHKLPIIPEPLGLISLQRSENRVDPIASMGSIFIAAFIAVVLATVMVFWPPWVPGT